MDRRWLWREVITMDRRSMRHARCQQQQEDHGHRRASACGERARDDRPAPRSPPKTLALNLIATLDDSEGSIYSCRGKSATYRERLPLKGSLDSARSPCHPIGSVRAPRCACPITAPVRERGGIMSPVSEYPPEWWLGALGSAAESTFMLDQTYFCRLEPRFSHLLVLRSTWLNRFRPGRSR